MFVIKNSTVKEWYRNDKDYFFVIGLVIGEVLGIFFTSLCKVSKNSNTYKQDDSVARNEEKKQKIKTIL